MDTDTELLPEYTIRNILSRIPVRSLIQFQCVSKQWRTLIKTPSFMAEHLRRQSPCLLFTGEENRPLELRLLDCERQLRRVQEPHLVPGLDSDSIMGSSNGLLCLQISRTTVLVWNPAIGELRMTPDAEVGEPSMGYSSLGFGFSPSINDHKIAIIWYEDFPSYVQVYSLTSGSWKVVEHEILEGIRLSREWESPSVAANGAIFWLGEKDGAVMIVSFDIALELFTLIPFPATINHFWSSRLVVHENKLALFLERRLSEDSESIDLWVMEEGGVASSSSGERWSWTKKYNTTIPCYLYPLRIWKNEIVCKVEEDVSKKLGGDVVKSRITLFNVTIKTYCVSTLHIMP